ncbi:MAG: arginine--tRNA ligase [Bacteroidales bacterium]|jgi:arginyl-tRNA synthetase|nr:arginine--tRNA ligase [Bacteroidales bacterium]
MIFENQIKEVICSIVAALYSCNLETDSIQVQKTKKDFKGDFTVVIFPFVRYSKKSPDATAEEIGQNMVNNLSFIKEYNVIKGFLNIMLNDKSWIDYFNDIRLKQPLSDLEIPDQSPVIVEFSSPNTNKPLHLGHVRNNLLGNSVCNILEANKYKVVRVNLVNDRGIHICKSMLAWIKSGKGETPESSGMKGDKLVGKYYVEFDRLYKQEINDLVSKGLSEEQAEKQAPALIEAQQMLQQWEEGDPYIRNIWTKMNDWVYQGFDETYKRLGIRFDKTYYESNTYLLGKKILDEGLNKKVFYKHDDGSVRVSLEDEGLDEKILLRSNGTSVYITQDLGTASLRANEFQPQKMIYIVGNEQNYHFDVLKLILDRKLGYTWGKNIYHLSYGMVELPSGKMKSREGTVVDADDLIESMILIAQENTERLGKTSHFSPTQLKHLFTMTGIGALKYFILKVDPKKNMLFNPEESIDMNGNTAPFIQYTHARICSLLRKAEAENININTSVRLSEIPEQEKELLRVLYEYPSTVIQAGKELNPALIANYTYELVKTYNHFYQETPIVREENKELRVFRLQISLYTATIIKEAMKLLGIDVPEQM